MSSHTSGLPKFSDHRIKLTVLSKNAKILRKQYIRFFFLYSFYTFNYFIPILCKNETNQKKQHLILKQHFWLVKVLLYLC